MPKENKEIKVTMNDDQIKRNLILEFEKDYYYVSLYFSRKDFELQDIVIKDEDGEGYSEFSKYEEDRKVYDTLSKFILNSQYINKKINKYKCQI